VGPRPHRGGQQSSRARHRLPGRLVSPGSAPRRPRDPCSVKISGTDHLSPTSVEPRRGIMGRRWCSSAADVHQPVRWATPGRRPGAGGNAGSRSTAPCARQNVGSWVGPRFGQRTSPHDSNRPRSTPAAYPGRVGALAGSGAGRGPGRAGPGGPASSRPAHPGSGVTAPGAVERPTTAYPGTFPAAYDPRPQNGNQLPAGPPSCPGVVALVQVPPPTRGLNAGPAPGVWRRNSEATPAHGRRTGPGQPGTALVGPRVRGRDRAVLGPSGATPGGGARRPGPGPAPVPEDPPGAAVTLAAHRRLVSASWSC